LKHVLGFSLVSAALMALVAVGLYPQAYPESSGCDGGLCAFELLLKPLYWVDQALGLLLSGCAGVIAVVLLGVSAWAARLPPPTQ
jgi:hypothetical protein